MERVSGYFLLAASMIYFKINPANTAISIHVNRLISSSLMVNYLLVSTGFFPMPKSKRKEENVIPFPGSSIPSGSSSVQPEDTLQPGGRGRKQKSCHSGDL